MSTDTSWTRPNVIRKVREQLGLSIEDVANQTQKLAKAHYARVTERQLADWEAGSTAPEIEHLETLAEVYQCPVGYFFLDAPPEMAAPLSFRGLAAGKEEHFTAVTQSSLRRFVETAEWFISTIEERGIDWPVRVPAETNRGSGADDLAEEARRRLGFTESVRQTWATPDDGFQWWRRRIEDEGVFCLQMILDPKDVRGASLWIEGRYPFVLVNHRDAEAATGRLFTLLHEYGHLLLADRRGGITCDFRGREPGQGTEPPANRFAARVLLTGPELRRYLEDEDEARFRENWTDQLLKNAAANFFVSSDVIAILLEEIKLAPPGFYQRKRDLWEKRYERWRPWGRGKGTKKWQRKARELGSSGVRIILELQDKGDLPALDVAYLLDTKVDKLDGFMDGFRTVVAE